MAASRAALAAPTLPGMAMARKPPPRHAQPLFQPVPSIVRHPPFDHIFSVGKDAACRFDNSPENGKAAAEFR
jgi:hypothetical protein